jgi:hypothetical protein
MCFMALVTNQFTTLASSLHRVLSACLNMLLSNSTCCCCCCCMLQCVPVNTKFDNDGFNPDLTSTDGQPLSDCPAFLVQGMPRSLVEPILLSGQVGQV